jgi:glucokinase
VSRIVGIDLGGSKLSAVAVESEQWQAPVGRGRRPHPDTPDELVDSVVGLYSELGGGADTGLGLGVAGLLDAEAGVLVSAPHLPGRDVDLAGLVADRVGLRPALLNDADAAALAELHGGAAEGRSNVVVLTIGTGIGCGLVIGGRVHRGRGFAGEPGHMTLAPGGDLCPCGRRGCWETLVSGRVLDEGARRMGVGSSAAELALAAAAGQAGAAQAMREAGTWLGRGLAVLAAVLDPEVFVIGGGAAAASGDLLLDPARGELDAWSSAQPGRAPTPVVPARFGPDAGAIGAALNWALSANAAPDLS